MILVSPKHCIRTIGDTRRTTGQSSGYLFPLFEVDDFVAPIFEEDNKEVVMEYLKMCYWGQATTPIYLHLPLAAQVFKKKRKKVFHTIRIE